MERVTSRPPLSGPAVAFLEGRRAELNQRFARMRRRFPAISAEAVLANLADVLPPLAGPEPAASDLLSAAYDLVLLHTARDTLGPATGLGQLLRQTFPRIRPLLLERPSALPAALANAVENLGRRGMAFASALAEVGPSVSRASELLDLGAVLAWRLGEARLRTAALAILNRLPARALLDVLGLVGAPPTAAPLVAGALRADAWRAPAALFTPATLATLAGGEPATIARLAARLAEPPKAPLAAFTALARAGDFTGFGGAFDLPPLLLATGDDRHVLFVRAGEQDFRVEADIFGTVASPIPRLDVPVQAAEPAVWLRRRSSEAPALGRDGTLTAFGERARLPALAGASSLALRPGLVAATSPDSHRIRILGPRGAAL